MKIENPKILFIPISFLISLQSSLQVVAGSTSNFLIEPSINVTGMMGWD